MEEKERHNTIRKIKEAIDEGLDKKYITKEEHKAMAGKDKEPAKFYINFKVHKDHKPNEAPLPRPIVSGSGSICENTGKFVQHQLKHLQILFARHPPLSPSNKRSKKPPKECNFSDNAHNGR